jgi:hypothetical protein
MQLIQKRVVNHGILVSIMLLAHAAWADKPTLDQTKATVASFWKAIQNSDKAAGDLLASSFWYEGIEYGIAGIGDNPEIGKCLQKFGKHGTLVPKQVVAFAPCATLSDWSESMISDEQTWTIIDPEHLPKALAKHKAKLAKLKDNLVVSLRVVSGPMGYTDVFAATIDGAGHVKLSALLASEGPADPAERP